MIRLSTSFYCRRCGHVRRFTKRGLNRRRHLLATILSCGLWGVVWYILHRQEQQRSWRCSICRGRQRPAEQPPEIEETDDRRVAVASVPIAPRR